MNVLYAALRFPFDPRKYAKTLLEAPFQQTWPTLVLLALLWFIPLLLTPNLDWMVGLQGWLLYGVMLLVLRWVYTMGGLRLSWPAMLNYHLTSILLFQVLMVLVLGLRMLLHSYSSVWDVLDFGFSVWFIMAYCKGLASVSTMSPWKVFGLFVLVSVPLVVCWGLLRGPFLPTGT